ncbi:hypothetical protein CBR_g30508 [Chara braunii]|uniref:DDE Tnp4 domain-containing protein n=1 Tax=Chara braunii TaxID=69332 RepID=A0A388LCW2_CHABU|nr:hypothetical protein CBR_g30508 [Chara braunii]|eukprot:GBG80140.1 hypothetical protein CBR_g30508 [Chara braunii]
MPALRRRDWEHLAVAVMAVAGRMAEDAFDLVDSICDKSTLCLQALLKSGNDGLLLGDDDADDSSRGGRSLLWLWPTIVDLCKLLPRASPRWWVMRRTGGLWKDLLPCDDAEDDHYLGLLRMRRSSFDRILRKVGPLLEREVTKFRVPLDPAKKLAYALHRWAHGESHWHTCSGYGMGKTSGLRAIREVAEAIIACYRNKVGFGGFAERHRRMQLFDALGFLNCWGCIDCTHVYMDKPRTRDGDDYCSGRFNRFSIVTQLVVDSELKILDFCYGFPGTVGDGRALKSTSLYKRGLQGSLFLDDPADPFAPDRPAIAGVPGGYLLAYCGYPSLPWIVTPYGQAPNVTMAMQQFDALHKIVRSCVERFFGVFKMRFQFFYCPHVTDITREGLEFEACCILHNLFQEWGDMPQEDLELSNASSPDTPPPRGGQGSVGLPLEFMFGRERGQAMRDALCAEVVRLYEIRREQ